MNFRAFVFLSFLTSSVLLFTIGCEAVEPESVNNQADANLGENEINMDLSNSQLTSSTINLDTAKHWTCTWQDKTQTSISSNLWSEIQFDAFFIPKEDLVDLIREDTIIGARAYLGLKYDSNGKPTPHLLFVGVGETDSTDITSMVADFTSPCPPACNGNEKSPLFDCD
jgi:hypothetical protein